MTEISPSDRLPSLRLGAASAEVTTLEDYFATDQRRIASFLTHYGTWRLPADAAASLGADRARLEWFHETGELVLIAEPAAEDGEDGAGGEGGAVVDDENYDEELPEYDGTVERAEATLDEAASILAGPFGGAGYVHRGADGELHETALGQVAAADTRVAIVATIAHGTRVHKQLWGWHRKHRRDDGWDWLVQQLS